MEVWRLVFANVLRLFWCLDFIVNCVCFDNKISPLSKQIGKSLSMACVAYKILLTGQFVVLGHILSYIQKVTLSLNKMDCIEYEIQQNSCMYLAHEISFWDLGIKVSLCCK